MIESEQFCNLPDSKYPKLSELYQKLFETPLTNAHDAMEDVRTTMKCYWEMQRRGIHYVPDVLELRDFLYHLARIQIEDEEKRLARR